MELNIHQPNFESALNHLKEQLSAIHTGRATPSIIENIMVESYGTKIPLLQLASINAPEPKQLIVQPWDVSNFKSIEKALQEADLGFGIAVQEKVIRLNIPLLTAERRAEITKKVHEIVESSKVRIRQIREKIREEISQAEKNKEIPEDEKYKLFEGLDQLTREYALKIEEVGKKKEQEIMKI